MSEDKNANCPRTGEFGWNELVATDEAGAKKFYTSLFNWTTQPFGGGEYTLFKQGETMIGGMMKCPKPGLPSHWLAYVVVEDVDATAAQAVKLGGKMMMDPFDVPTVGRIAVFTDPYGAAIGVFKPQM
jgi:predicted enzyme related to lactoylglutathione lyase